MAVFSSDISHELRDFPEDVQRIHALLPVLETPYIPRYCEVARMRDAVNVIEEFGLSPCFFDLADWLCRPTDLIF